MGFFRVAKPFKVVWIACGLCLAFLGSMLDAKAHELSSTDNRRFLFLGNSLTLRPASAELGWPRSHGMAASKASSDYAHVTLALLGRDSKSADIVSAYPVESDENKLSDLINGPALASADNYSVVVLQLGDNVRFTPKGLFYFWFAYRDLVGKVKGKNSKLFCLTTWWHSRVKDFVIKSRCEAAGGQVVFIGDLYTDPNNLDRRNVDYQNKDVDRHPKDWGMKEIARRLAESIEKSSHGGS